MAGVEYLEAKRTVDDRSLSDRAIERLRSAISPTPRIAEAGCGTGRTLPRLVDWGITDGQYLGIDTDAAVIEHARDSVPAELRQAGYDLREHESGGRVESLEYQFTRGDALELLGDHGGLDLVVAQQFVDLVDTEPALETFTDALAPGGLLYLPLTFDGVSIFQPGHQADDAMIAAYHESMDRRPGGDSRTGRHVADRLRKRPGELLVMDSSDAVIRPRDGEYPAEERFVLDTILDFVADEVTTSDVPARDEWLSTRRQQLEDGDLLYVAHRYDFLYRTPKEE